MGRTAALRSLQEMIRVVFVTMQSLWVGSIVEVLDLYQNHGEHAETGAAAAVVVVVVDVVVLAAAAVVVTELTFDVMKSSQGS